MPAETVPFVGKGGTFGYNTAATPPITLTTTYTTAVWVKTFAPNFSIGEADNVVLASVFKDMLPTIPEGTADFSAKYVPGDPGTAQFISLAMSGTVAHFAYKTLAGSLLQFDGFFTSFKITFENESVVECEGTLRIKTLPVFTPATT